MYTGQSADRMPDSLPPEIFLETSIFLAMLKGDSIKKIAETEIAKFCFKGSSSYVKLEYGNNILAFAKYYKAKLEKYKSLEDLRFHINNELRPSLSKHRKYQLWFFNLLSKHFNEPEATERALDTLEDILIEGTDHVSNLCDLIIDQINCIWSDQHDDWKSPCSCENKKPGCRIDRFFVENKELFLKIYDEIVNNDAGTELTEQLKGFVLVIDSQDQNRAVSAYI